MKLKIKRLVLGLLPLIHVTEESYPQHRLTNQIRWIGSYPPAPVTVVTVFDLFWQLLRDLNPRLLSWHKYIYE